MKITRFVFGGYCTISEVNAAARIAANDTKCPSEMLAETSRDCEGLNSFNILC